MDDTEAFNDFIANTADDLFADDDEDDYLNETYYNQNETSANVDEFLRKKNAKYGPFSTTTFWSRTDNAKYDLKNHLWDFMVYNNIREHSFNNYKSKVEIMRSELMLNIINCKKDVLNVPGNSKFRDLTSEEIEHCYDSLISDLLDMYGVKLNKSEFVADSSNLSEITKQAEQYVGSHIKVIQLDREIREYKKRKIELVKCALYELLKSFNEFRNKILEEVYQDSKGGKMDLTRFVKNMDKVTSRFDFFGEYRFHNIRTYYKHKEEVDSFVANYIAFNNFTNDFTLFENTFNPNYSATHFDAPKKADDNDTEVAKDDSTSRSTVQETNRTDESVPEVAMDGDIDEIFDFMGGVQSQSFIQTQEVEMDKDKEKTPESGRTEKKETEEPDQVTTEEDSESLKLLQEARKKAAEILRLKRIQRMQPQEQ